MTGDPTLDAVFSGICSVMGVAIIFEIAVRWLMPVSRTGAGGGVDD